MSVHGNSGLSFNISRGTATVRLFSRVFYLVHQLTLIPVFLCMASVDVCSHWDSTKPQCCGQLVFSLVLQIPCWWTLFAEVSRETPRHQTATWNCRRRSAGTSHHHLVTYCSPTRCATQNDNNAPPLPSQGQHSGLAKDGSGLSSFIIVCHLCLVICLFSCCFCFSVVCTSPIFSHRQSTQWNAFFFFSFIANV